MSTVTPTQPLVSPPPPFPFTPRRITVDEYDRIIASGSLNDPKKVELIDGYMVTKMAKSAGARLFQQGSRQGPGEVPTTRVDVAAGAAGADDRV